MVKVMKSTMKMGLYKQNNIRKKVFFMLRIITKENYRLNNMKRRIRKR